MSEAYENIKNVRKAIAVAATVKPTTYYEALRLTDGINEPSKESKQEKQFRETVQIASKIARRIMAPLLDLGVAIAGDAYVIEKGCPYNRTQMRYLLKQWFDTEQVDIKEVERLYSFNVKFISTSSELPNILFVQAKPRGLLALLAKEHLRVNTSKEIGAPFHDITPESIVSDLKESIDIKYRGDNRPRKTDTSGATLIVVNDLAADLFNGRDCNPADSLSCEGTQGIAGGNLVFFSPHKVENSSHHELIHYLQGRENEKTGLVFLEGETLYLTDQLHPFSNWKHNQIDYRLNKLNMYLGQFLDPQERFNAFREMGNPGNVAIKIEPRHEGWGYLFIKALSEQYSTSVRNQFLALFTPEFYKEFYEGTHSLHDPVSGKEISYSSVISYMIHEYNNWCNNQPNP